MKNRYTPIAGLLALLLLAACSNRVDSPQGFRLPDGDPAAGRDAFVAVGCVQCHTIVGDTLPEPEIPRTLNVQLGGDARKVKTYAQLVTSIIYPSHSIKDKNAANYQDETGKSLMPDLTSDMTVRQLVDITQYLQPHYKVVIPEYPRNGIYYP